MRGKKFRILSIFLGVGIAINLLLGALFSIIGMKNKKTPEINNGDFYYANANEQTDASIVSSVYKGGSIYIGPNSSYIMKDGVISNHHKSYGGAVYVSSGATFTMQGGVIEGNSATYGGAVYVESGGTFIMIGGTIRNNSAKTAPAVYIEDGGTFTMNANCVIEDNYYIASSYKISEDTIKVGHLTDGIDMHYIEFGLYPQTYVGNTMNETLEAWYQAENPIIVKTYTTEGSADYPGTGVWDCYLYSDGNYYARGLSLRNDKYNYLNGDAVPLNEIVWFKVEPLKWVIINYDKFIANETSNLEVLSYYGLLANLTFHQEEIPETDRNLWINSKIRLWLNNIFVEQAFTKDERLSIKVKTVLNNITGDCESADSDGKGPTTYDRVYNLSSYEAKEKYFNSNEQRLCSPTDFALSNNTFISNNSAMYPSGVTCHWFLRSAGAVYKNVSDSACSGNVSVNHYFYDITSPNYSIRPAMTLVL